jgi:hypothetical protein
MSSPLFVDSEDLNIVYVLGVIHILALVGVVHVLVLVLFLAVLHVLVLMLFLVLVIRVELAGEEVDIAEESSSAARVELPRAERDSVVRCHLERRIGTQILRQDGSAAPDLMAAPSPLMWPGRHWYAAVVQVPVPSQQACIQPWHRTVPS